MSPIGDRTRRARSAALLAAMLLVLAGCGGGDAFPREEATGCALGECYISFSNLGQEDSFSNNLSLIATDGDETVDVVITFSVEEGRTTVAFTDAAGEEVVVDVAAGAPVTVAATLDAGGIVFRYSPDGSIEGGNVAIVPAD